MERSVNTIRGLAIDMINQANSGHPGIAMGASPMLYTLFKNHMHVTKDHPHWINRDRFVLSAGHGSSMLYALYHLLGYDISIEDLKQFRQIASKTPGHPEYLDVPGVEATTGPLGQGVAMGVGLALASKKLAKIFNQGQTLIDNYTYLLCGDGDLMEGISYEACSFAGHNQLDNLIVLYDSNDISLDGSLNLSFSEDIKQRFTAQGWDYLKVDNGEDISSINNAINEAKTKDKPVLIEVKTTIGYGSQLQGTSKVHGAPLSSEDYLNVRQFYQLDETPFSVSEEVYNDFNAISTNTNQLYENWLAQEQLLKTNNPELYRLWQRLINQEKVDWTIEGVQETIATRKAGNIGLNQLSQVEPLLLTGSADLSASNLTNVDNNEQNIFYGVREFSMGAIANGINLFAKSPVAVSTFFVFSDYLKPAIRLASLMKLPITYIFTHDSVYVGEDGPTHQPIEQIAMFRSMPNVNLWRPCDANEALCCLKNAYLATNTPNILALTRQDLVNVTGSNIDEIQANIDRGAYEIYVPESYSKTIIASGSEVQLAMETAKELGNIRVISMPCFDVFINQEQAYIDHIIGNKDTNYVIEFASTYGLDYFVNNHNHIIGIDRFGASGPAHDVINYLQLDKESIKQVINND